LNKPEENVFTEISRTRAKPTSSDLSESINLDVNMEKLRKNLKKSAKLTASENLKLKQNLSGGQQFQNRPHNLKIKDDLKIQRLKLSESTPNMKIRSHLISEPKDKKEVIIKPNTSAAKPSDVLVVLPVAPRSQTLHSNSQSLKKPVTMKAIRKKIKKNGTNLNTLRLPSVNPETPPVMVIKSHIMKEPKNENIKINEDILKSSEDFSEKLKIELKKPMSIKSHVKSQPKNEITKIKEGILKVPENSSEKLKIKPELKKPMSIKSHVKSEPKNESIKINEDILKASEIFSEKLKIESELEKPMSIISHVKSEPNNESVKIKEDIIKASEHFSENPKIKPELKKPMSIKSHVKSAPKPAESMEIILKKIAQDLESKDESNEATLPPLVQKFKSKQEINTEGPEIDEIKLESQQQLDLKVRKDPEDKINTEIKKVVSDLKVSSKEDSLTKSVREDIVDIMKQVELMKETKPSMTETSKATDKKVPRKLKIAQGNTDGSRQEFITSSFEDTTVPVRY